MELKELKTILESTGFPVAYMHFENDEHVSMPFITYCESYSSNFFADDSVCEKISSIQIDLWTKKKDQEAEARVETALASFTWNSTDTEEEVEKCYRRTYTLKI